MARSKDQGSGSPARATETATDSVARVLAGQDGIRGWQEDAYRAFHQHPELPDQEVRTAATAAAALRNAGYEVHEGIGTTGVVGVLKNGDGPTVLVRADMDALPMKEETGLPYASTDHQTDGSGQAVTGCACVRPRRARGLPDGRGAFARRPQVHMARHVHPAVPAC